MLDRLNAFGNKQHSFGTSKISEKMQLINRCFRHERLEDIKEALKGESDPLA